MTGGAPAIPPFDYSRFQWRQSPDDTNLYLREAFGGEVIEDFFSRFNHGEQTLYLGLHVTLHNAISPGDFLSQAREAWKALRHQVPTVAAKIAYDAAGNTLLTYRQAASSQEITDWANRTARLSNEPQGLDQLRYELSKVQIPDENGTLTLLYILPGTSETSYSLLLHTSHVPFDGGGIKVLGNKLLALLAQYLADGGKSPALHWGEEGKNLLPCVTEILGPDEDREGDKYTQTLTEVLGDIGAALPVAYRIFVTPRRH
jgi:15-O-acetyltransferase Tri3